MTKRYFEDFSVGDVEEFGCHVPSEEEIIEFATEFDPQPFHIDPDAAKDHFFGGIIASGWHTGSMLMRMIVDHQIGNSASMGSPGIDELRWISPVRPEENLKAKSEVLEVTPHKYKSDRGFVKFRHTVLTAEGEIKMTMISSILFGCKPVAEGV
ncbi:MaoC family dehydratase [Sneathiella glossodoripedis]|uniref:MaoC family dehydratase n=1 Tax=Sneathiella glossodoripedis TaxID=418853 RepID=UPI000470A67F|nr:MaoC family dehydratase [Sneathiella glossodoripedis]